MAVNTQLAVVFPGQGSQQVGMLADLYEQWPIVAETFAQASEILGFDLWQLVAHGPQEQLNLTENAQPALLTAGVAVWRVLQQELNLQPALMAGHSLGEWTALVCAGVLAFEDAVKLVHLRGRFMQQAVPVGVGSMAAIIGLDDESIVSCCAKAEQGEVVAAVNFNSPGQVVIAGHVAAVERAGTLCKEAGAKRVLPLAVSAPFHTELMRPAAERLAEAMSSVSFSAPEIAIIHNVHGQPEISGEAIKQIMIEQIYSPVRWVACVHAMVARGGVEFIECGPGKILCGLVKRIDRAATAHGTDSTVAIEDLKNHFK